MAYLMVWFPGNLKKAPDLFVPSRSRCQQPHTKMHFLDVIFQPVLLPVLGAIPSPWKVGNTEPQGRTLVILTLCKDKA